MRSCARNLLIFSQILLIFATLVGCARGPQQAVIPAITPPDPAPVPGHKPSFLGFAPVTADRSTLALTSSGGRDIGSSVVAVELPAPSLQRSFEPAPQAATAPQAAPAAANAAGERPYVVQPGDTLYALARREQVSPQDLAARNLLTPPFGLQVGQSLWLPGQTKATGGRYVVVRGDTLYSIARRHQTSVAALQTANGLSSSGTLAPGQALQLPAGAAAPSQVPSSTQLAKAVVKTPSPTAKATPQPQSAPASAASKPVAAKTVSLPPTPEPPAPAVTQTAASAAPPKALSSPPPRASSTFLWPVDGRIILGYGPKGGGLQNDGINIAAPRGTPVRAAENGVIAYTGNELRGFGNLVLIKHGDGWTTAYAHVERVIVGRGDRVERGQIIGLVGSSGNVSAPQLHFEVRKGTDAIDPLPMLSKQTAALVN